MRRAPTSLMRRIARRRPYSVLLQELLVRPNSFDRLPEWAEDVCERGVGNQIVLLKRVSGEIVEVLLLRRIVTNVLVGVIHRNEVYAVVRLNERNGRLRARIGEEGAAHEVRGMTELQKIGDRGGDVYLRVRAFAETRGRHVARPSKHERGSKRLFVRAELVVVNAVFVRRVAVIANKNDKRVTKGGACLERAKECLEPGICRSQGAHVVALERRVPVVRGNVLGIRSKRVVM